VIDLATLEAARRRIAPVVIPTPVRRSASLSRVVGRPILLKPEQEQRTGSFKIRGAYNRIAQLPAGVPVVAASAGNHAQGVALAATETERPSTIFMPVGASIPKVDATAAYGATVRLQGEVVDDCIVLARAFAAETGAVYIPPFDDPDVIAGQGTVGLELADEAPDAEVVVVPTGGGGLLAGVALALALVRPGIRVVGAEAAGAPTLTAALAAGHPVALSRMATMADGIALRSTADLPLALITAYVEEVVTVDEEELSRAMLLLVERAKSVVEPSGAAGLAALLSGRVAGNGPAVAVLSGGNVDPVLLTRIVEHGLAAAGRFLSLRVVIRDRPGALAALSARLAALRLNVLSVEHHRWGRSLDPDEVEVLVTVETRSGAQHKEVVDALSAVGFHAEPVD
jgi:threonine dehydratase